MTGPNFTQLDFSASSREPFEARVEAVMRVINAHADTTGKKVMYAFNISDEYDAMQRAIDTGIPYQSPLKTPPGQGPRHGE